MKNGNFICVSQLRNATVSVSLSGRWTADIMSAICFPRTNCCRSRCIQIRIRSSINMWWNFLTFRILSYPIQVGGEDYRIDLLFFHRSLRCLVAIELKVGKFKPEYVSKMDFYLEGLDRQIRKSDENPSVGLLLCASKNDEVVEYAMSRTLSPMMVSQYQLQLPDKDILRKKLQELSSLSEIEENSMEGNNNG